MNIYRKAAEIAGQRKCHRCGRLFGAHVFVVVNLDTGERALLCYRCKQALDAEWEARWEADVCQDVSVATSGEA